MKQMQKTETLVLVEGAAWGDAEFYGRWLLDAAKANDLLNEAKDDDEFWNRIETLEEHSDGLDFGIMAIVFLSQFEKELHTFVLETDFRIWKNLYLWLRWDSSR